MIKRLSEGIDLKAPTGPHPTQGANPQSAVRRIWEWSRPPVAPERVQEAYLLVVLMPAPRRYTCGQAHRGNAMHFIFLGPGEIGSWDQALFWTQLALAVAAASSPFIAYVLGNRRERRVAHAARMRQRRAERAADNQLAREKSSYSESVFYAIHLETHRIKEDVDKVKMIWHDSGNLPTGDTLHLQIDIPFAMGEASLWLHLTDPRELRATIDLVNALSSYNREIERLHGWAGEFITDKLKVLMREKTDKLEDAVNEILKSAARIPRTPFRNRLIL